MKYHILICLTVVSLSIKANTPPITNQNPPSVAGIQPFTNNIYVDNKITIADNQLTANLTQTTSQMSNQSLTTLLTIKQTCTNIVIESAAKTYAQWLKWRKTILLSGAALAYAIPLAYTLKARRLIVNSHAWCNWQAARPLDELSKTPTATLYEMLKKDIESTYKSPDIHILVNLTRFLNDTGAELDTLRSFDRFANTVDSCYLARIFFITPFTLKQINNRIKRLIFIRAIIAQTLEPDNVIHQLSLVNSPYLAYRTLRPRVLSRHH